MIVRDRPTGFNLFLILRGSVLQRIRWVLCLNVVLALLVTLAHGNLFDIKITLTPIPFTLIGLPLAIFLGFRNTTAYNRFWEGRKLWGELTIWARTLSRQCQSMIHVPLVLDAHNRVGDVRVRMVHRAIAHAHALRSQLRGHQDDGALERWLTAEDWFAMRNQPLNYRPDALLLANSRDLSDCLRKGWIDSMLASQIDKTLTGMTAAAASCERIRHTPIPFSYTLLLHRTAYLYCFLLPFGLVDTTGFMTPFVVAIVAYTFFGLDTLGDELEEPFGVESNDLPLDAMCRGIEISLCQSLGDPDVPPPLQPLDYRLT
ncbi:MAG: bestrophin family protein [Acidovorax sp.]|jgi:putative membrane protein|nr:bestrophin family protein [Acidovorax sp.]